MKYVLILIAILFSSQAVALNCKKQPTCEELNYSKDDDPQCAEDGYVLCPFDFSYKKCLQPDCESLGFTQSDKSDWCADIAHCKTDESFTACQSPCFATTYEELSNLAESGKCKTITMKNDIIIPDKRGIILAANTTLDGGNHTLSITNLTSTSLIYLKNQSSVKNLKMTCTECPKSPLIKVEGNTSVYLSDLDLNSSVKNSEDWASMIVGGGSGNTHIYLSGRISIIANGHRAIGFGDFKLNNAVFHVEATQADALADSGLTAENSQIYVSTTSSSVFVRMRVSLTNSTLEGYGRGVFLRAKDADTGSFTLKEGASAILTARSMFTNIKKEEIIFEGTAEKPASLTISTPKLIDSGGEQTSVNVKNTNATLTINGTTYKPTQIDTTLLSEVENSQNWQSEP